MTTVWNVLGWIIVTSLVGQVVGGIIRFAGPGIKFIAGQATYDACARAGKSTCEAIWIVLRAAVALASLGWLVYATVAVIHWMWP
jgi:hypothetical protein